MKLIILGNGFDLHHKYKTSFYDFRTHLKDSENNEDQILISEIDRLLGVSDDNQKAHLLWNDFESIIGNIVITSSHKSRIAKNIPSLVEKFTQNFYNYLLSITKKELTQINETLAEEFRGASSVLSFNYTSFYLPYINDNDIDVFHIHGELSEKNLPIIGYYYPNAIASPTSLDFSLKYGGKEIHKSALALKQNEIDLDAHINRFAEKWKNKISEIVIIGYSFGLSDNHIYNILNKIMVQQIKEINIPSSKAKNINTIEFKIYNYNEKESNQLIGKIKTGLSSLKIKFLINITGVGFTRKEKEIITFKLKDYN